MSETTEQTMGASELVKVIASSDGNTARLVAGIVPTDLKMAHSDDGQYLFIHCGDEFVAMYGAMGGSPAAVEFADGGSYSVEELLDLVSGV